MAKPKPYDALWLLRRVRRVLGDKNRFCQGAYARNTVGWTVPTNHPSAVQWCLVGGVLRGDSRRGTDSIFGLACGEGSAAQNDALDALNACIPKSFRLGHYGRVSEYSEKKGHAAVVKLLDKAIARLEKTHA